MMFALAMGIYGGLCSFAGMSLLLITQSDEFALSMIPTVLMIGAGVTVFLLLIQYAAYRIGLGAALYTLPGQPRGQGPGLGHN